MRKTIITSLITIFFINISFIHSQILISHGIDYTELSQDSIFNKPKKRNCANVGFYVNNDMIPSIHKKLLEELGPVDCSFQEKIIAKVYDDAFGYIKPGFDFIIHTDDYSQTNNSLQIFINDNPVGGWAPIDPNPGWGAYLGYVESDRKMNYYSAEYIGWNPKRKYTFKWCDNGYNGWGSFNYYLIDHADVVGMDNPDYLNTPKIDSGTFIHSISTPCFTVVMDSLKGLARYEGNGIINDVGSGEVTFKASLAKQGTHSITYYWDDQKGCSDSATHNITVFGPQVLASVNQDTICKGDSTTLTAYGSSGTGSGTYLYTWSPALTLNNRFLSNPTAFPDTTTTYRVIITDHNGYGCKDTAYVTVNVIEGPSIEVTSNPPFVCHGESATLSVSGADSYVWDNSSTSNSINVTPNATTTYSVTGTDFTTGCTTVGTYTLDLLKTNVVFQADTLEGCPPLTVNFIDLTDDENATSWLWSFGDNNTSSEQNATHTYTTSGLKNVTLSLSNSHGCKSDTTYIGYINVYPTPDPEITTVPENSATINNPKFTFNSTTIATKWFWEFGNGDTSASSPPVDYIYPEEENSYTVKLRVENIYGCADSTTKEVRIVDLMVFTNIITPNGDDINDKFEIQNIESYPDNTLIIYNRWGSKVYEKDNYDNSWAGQDLAEGTYFFVLKYKDNNAEEHSQTGSLTILRTN